VSSSLDHLTELAELTDFVHNGLERIRKLCDSISRQTGKDLTTEYYKLLKTFDSLVSEAYDEVLKKDEKTSVE